MQHVREEDAAETWVSYARDIYRNVCAELVFLDMGSRNISNKVRSSKLAWLRKRIEDMEPEQAAHAVRPLLQNYKHSLDQVTSAWLPFVSGSMGANDEYHNEFWATLATADEQKCLSISYGILQRQLYDSYDEETAGLLLQCSCEALSRHNCKVQLVYRLMQPLQRSEILQYAKLGKKPAAQQAEPANHGKRNKHL